MTAKKTNKKVAPNKVAKKATKKPAKKVTKKAPKKIPDAELVATPEGCSGRVRRMARKRGRR